MKYNYSEFSEENINDKPYILDDLEVNEVSQDVFIDDFMAITQASKNRNFYDIRQKTRYYNRLIPYDNL